MLTYEEDDDWNNWDGGYWGKDVYQNKKQNKLCKYFCFSVFFLCILLMIIGLIIYFVTGGQIMCSLQLFKNNQLCIDVNNSVNEINATTNMTNINSNNISTINISNLTKIMNNNSFNNFTFFQNNTIINTNNQQNNNEQDDNQNYINSTNITNLMLYQTSIKENIEKSDKVSKMETGSAVLISVFSVFIFIFIIIGSIYFGKYGKKKIKNFCTQKTASKQNSIKLTKEEMKLYEVKNPIHEALERNEDKDFVKAINTIKKAVEKDREHDYDEAIKLYNIGIDLVLKCLKQNKNASERFEIAKKVDIYLKRVNYITKCKNNEELINEINSESKVN